MLDDECPVLVSGVVSAGRVRVTVCPRRSSWGTNRRICSSSFRSRSLGTQVVVWLVPAEQVLRDHDHSVPDLHLGSSHTEPAEAAAVSFGEVVLAVHPAHGSGGPDHDRRQSLVPVPAPGRLRIGPRTRGPPAQSRPTLPGSLRNGTCHVAADLGDGHLRHPRLNPRDPPQEVDLALPGFRTQRR